MKKKKYVHAVKLNTSDKSRKGSTTKKVRTRYKSVNKKALSDIFDKYYKNQVNALYRAVNDIDA
jgi:lysine/ornithine N-monooxygenase